MSRLCSALVVHQVHSVFRIILLQSTVCTQIHVWNETPLTFGISGRRSDQNGKQTFLIACSNADEILGCQSIFTTGDSY
jgi:hypothetical protein